jgi:malate dehydrogenase (quinone)
VNSDKVDVALIGGGIMSATLATLLNELQPDWNIQVYERLGELAQESSNPWNNAGTGHAALCELNYMPQAQDGSVTAEKAVAINEQFQISRQLWSHLVQTGVLPEPEKFINSTPHMTFVHGASNVDYLRKRRDVLADQPLFAGLQYSEDPAVIGEWTPLITKKRKPSQKIAATRIDSGTDVDFGALTGFLFDSLKERGVDVHLNQQVTNLKQQDDGSWRIKLLSLVGRYVNTVEARFVFVGAGGGALALLQKSGIPEIKGFGGFPISGQFLRTRPRCTARPPSAPRPCRYRTWTPGSWTAKPRFSSARSPGSAPSSSSAAPGSTCPSRCARTTWCPCSPWPSTTSV